LVVRGAAQRHAKRNATDLPAWEKVTLFRFYGPDKAVFDKRWRLPDIEEIAAA